MGRKEDMAKLAASVMSNRENIRNIGIVAHIDHGKCLWGKADILLADGKIISAEQFYLNAALSGKKVAEDKEKTVYALDKPIQIFSVNKETGRIETKPVSQAWKLKGGRILKFRLRNGSEIATTPEHKFVLFDGIDFIEREARELKTGDRVTCARRLPVQSDYKTKEIVLRELAKKEFYAKLNKEFGEALKTKVIAYGTAKIVKEANVDIKSRSFYHGLWKNRCKISHLLALGNILEINLGRMYDEIEGIYFRGKTKNSLIIKLPQNFEDLFYLVGLFLGDGSKDRFVVGKESLGKEFVRICKDLGFNPTARRHEGKTPEYATNKTLLYLMNALFDYPLRQKSKNIHISEFVFTAPNSLISKLISGYFDCDGTVEESRRAISISSASKKMLKDLQIILLRFGCVSILNNKKNTIYNTLYITGESTKTFIDLIGFGLKEKQDKARILAEKNIGSTVLDTVPTGGFKKFRENKGLTKNEISKHYYKYENEIYAPVRSTYQNIMQTMLLRQNEAVKAKNIEDLAFIEITEITEGTEEFVYDFSVPETHNFIADGICIHNTTLTDNLVAAAGLIAEELAGKVQFMDYYELEQQRGITINAANISLVYKFNDKDNLINVIDTPGHVDFGGEVIRAMRAVDGVIVVMDAVEGIMPQTETVVRQALRENVKPVLFINKVDRLIEELQLTPEQMQERFVKAIAQVNNLIKKYIPKDITEDWTVKVQDGSVAFGSAKRKWAISIDTIKKTGIGFKEIYDQCKAKNHDELSKKSPLHRTILEMVIKHLPSPIKAQPYRLPKIWKGDLESEEGKAMKTCFKEDPFVMMITDVSVDPHAGDVATGRVYSGTAKKGQKIFLIGRQKEVVISQVAIYMGGERVAVDEIPAGNIGSIIGLKEASAGETVASKEIKEFEAFMSNVEPVMTVSVEAKNPKDLPKLIEVIRKITKEDPNVRATINQETGEHLLSGMGELHLEITQYRIEHDNKLEIQVGNPIVVYHETVSKESPTLEGKSPNKHNKFKLSVKPIAPETLEKLVDAKINQKIRPKDTALVKQLEEIGFGRDLSKRIWIIQNNNVLMDMTRGIQHLNEAKELIVQGFMDAMESGPNAQEKCSGVQIMLEDATLHEDAVHRGPAQILPVITRTIWACMLCADAIIQEPKQILTITVPQEFMGGVLGELQQRRTQIREMRQEGELSIIVGLAPVKELIGFSAAMRGSSQGRALWTAEYSGYENLDRQLQIATIKEIRKRKGLPDQLRKAEDFLD